MAVVLAAFSNNQFIWTPYIWAINVLCLDASVGYISRIGDGHYFRFAGFAVIFWKMRARNLAIFANVINTPSSSCFSHISDGHKSVVIDTLATAPLDSVDVVMHSVIMFDDADKNFNEETKMTDSEAKQVAFDHYWCVGVFIIPSDITKEEQKNLSDVIGGLGLRSITLSEERPVIFTVTDSCATVVIRDNHECGSDDNCAMVFQKMPDPITEAELEQVRVECEAAGKLFNCVFEGVIGVDPVDDMVYLQGVMSSRKLIDQTVLFLCEEGEGEMQPTYIPIGLSNEAAYKVELDDDGQIEKVSAQGGTDILESLKRDYPDLANLEVKEGTRADYIEMLLDMTDSELLQILRKNGLDEIQAGDLPEFRAKIGTELGGDCDAQEKA